MWSESGLEFAGLEEIEPADVGVDVCAHDDFVVCGEFVEEGIEGIKEASVDVLRAHFGAWVVDGRKSKGEVFGAFLPSNLFPHSIVAVEDDVNADVAPCEFTSCISCQWGLGSGGFLSLVVSWG